MIQLRLFSCKVQISFWFLVLLTLFCLLDKSFISLSLLLVILLHEGAHLVMLRLYGVPVRGLYFAPYGVRLDAPMGMLPRTRQAAVYLAAPFLNLLLAGVVLFFSPLSITGILSLCVGAYNLVPIAPLDGGNAALALFSHRSPERLLAALATLLLLPVYLAAIYLAMYHQNYSMLIGVIYLSLVARIKKT